MSNILSRKGATLGVKSLSLSIANMSDELLTRSLKIGLTGDFLPVKGFLDVAKQREIKQKRERANTSNIRVDCKLNGPD